MKLDSFGGVLIVGPKGCGKTTSAKQKANSIIEFQDAPKIWGAIRKSIDDRNESGLYILTGSSSKDIVTPHTGTIRISTLKMYPMSLFESGESSGEISLLDLFNTKKMDFVESKLTIDGLIFSICRGGWPRSLVNKTAQSQLEIANDLFFQICNRDISNIDGVKRNSKWSEKILRSYSRNICTLAETKTIFGDVNSTTDMTKPTYYDYIQALEKLYVIEDVPAWCPSIRSKEAMPFLVDF